MKRFKEFLTEKAKEEELSYSDLALGGTGTELAKEMLFGTNAGFDTALGIGGAYLVPKEKTRFNAEKVYNTDLGLMFDYDPNSGEVMGNQAGFQAVKERTKNDKNIPSAFPAAGKSAEEFSQEYRDNLLKVASEFFDPETYRKLFNVLNPLEPR